MAESFDQEIIHFVIRLNKEDAAFAYFILESHEGLAFYSTLTSSLKSPYRDIEIFTPICFEHELRHLLFQLQKQFTLDFLTDRIINDHHRL